MANIAWHALLSLVLETVPSSDVLPLSQSYRYASPKRFNPFCPQDY
jgi:hypothetical protein